MHFQGDPSHASRMLRLGVVSSTPRMTAAYSFLSVCARSAHTWREWDEKRMKAAHPTSPLRRCRRRRRRHGGPRGAGGGGAGGAHSGALGAVEDAALQIRAVRHLAHLAAQSIHLGGARQNIKRAGGDGEVTKERREGQQVWLGRCGEAGAERRGRAS